jgi:hypothetical protein
MAVRSQCVPSVAAATRDSAGRVLVFVIREVRTVALCSQLAMEVMCVRARLVQIGFAAVKAESRKCVRPPLVLAPVLALGSRARPCAAHSLKKAVLLTLDPLLEKLKEQAGVAAGAAAGGDDGDGADEDEKPAPKKAPAGAAAAKGRGGSWRRESTLRG